jgi:hypothetical protein
MLMKKNLIRVPLAQGSQLPQEMGLEGQKILIRISSIQNDLLANPLKNDLFSPISNQADFLAMFFLPSL